MVPVLEISMRSFCFAIMLGVVSFCAACSNVDQAELSAGDAFMAVLGSRVSSSATPETKPVSIDRAQFANVNAPIWVVTLEETGDLATIVQSAQNGPITTFQGADSVSVSFANGVVVATRGFGDDLMQSDMRGVVRGLQQGGGRYDKDMSYLDGQNQLETLRFQCTLVSQANEKIEILGKSHQTRRFVETCEHTDRQVTNRYWLENGKVVRSYQWISRNISPLVFEIL
ncbi:MAG: YjbF family lipoprotein [Pseudomonadota bacterium]